MQPILLSIFYLFVILVCKGKKNPQVQKRIVIVPVNTIQLVCYVSFIM